jgi:pyruvate carboxylase subunit B
LGEINQEVMKKAIGDEKPMTCRPADKLKPEINNLKVKCEDVAKSEEDLLTYAMFPDLANTFLKERNAGTLEPEELLDIEESKSSATKYAPSEFNVTLHGETYHIKLTGSGNPGQHEKPYHVVVDGISEEVLIETLDMVEVGNSESSKTTSGAPKSAGNLRPTHDGCVTTAMPGTVIDIKVNVGDQVNAGDSLIVIEAMKMENEIQAPRSGTVIGIHISKGQSISPDVTLIEIQA